MTTETKLQHTPGPWTVGNRYGNNLTVINSPNGSKAVATVWTHDRKRIDKRPTDADDFGESPEGFANARLIAAAPDLLERLTFAVERIRLANAEGDPILSAWLEDAEAAIAKAT